MCLHQEYRCSSTTIPVSTKVGVDFMLRYYFVVNWIYWV